MLRLGGFSIQNKKRELGLIMFIAGILISGINFTEFLLGINCPKMILKMMGHEICYDLELHLMRFGLRGPWPFHLCSLGLSWNLNIGYFRLVPPI